MVALSTTKLSAKRRVELPEAVCQRLGLSAGTELMLIERGDEIVLVKKGDRAAEMARFNEIMKEMRAHARRVGMKKSDITRTIKQVREAKRRKAG